MAAADEETRLPADNSTREERLSEEPKRFVEILAEELREIRTLRLEREGKNQTAKGGCPPVQTPKVLKDPDAVMKAAHEQNLGRLSSRAEEFGATFNLGPLQALADFDLLKRFDYLSTVSAGRYIGSWLVPTKDAERSSEWVLVSSRSEKKRPSIFRNSFRFSFGRLRLRTLLPALTVGAKTRLLVRV